MTTQESSQNAEPQKEEEVGPYDPALWYLMYSVGTLGLLFFLILLPFEGIAMFAGSLGIFSEVVSYFCLLQYKKWQSMLLSVLTLAGWFLILAGVLMPFAEWRYN